MNDAIITSVALTLDRAAAETPRLEWIEPLCKIKTLLLRCGRAAELSPDVREEALWLGDRSLALCLAGEADPELPQSLRRLLFLLLTPRASEESLRRQCLSCAEAVRAAESARPALEAISEGCIDSVRQEEEAAFSASVEGLRETFTRLLALRSAAIQAESARIRFEWLKELEALSGTLPSNQALARADDEARIRADLFWERFPQPEADKEAAGDQNVEKESEKRESRADIRRIRPFQSSETTEEGR